tara:strand:- start:259 stop:1020 length:762 start_codon:yes stop_codon:yes gene_type:complete
MIRIIKNSELDNQKLSQITTSIDDELEDFDFSKVVVNKPWGYEYLMYKTDDVSIWVLYLKKGCMTSMHCHIDKKTSLLVLSGEAICSTLEGGVNLKEGDGLTLDKKVFHSTQAISEEGVIMIEVETPTKKIDVLRLLDSYGREKKGYEGQEHMSNLKEFKIIDFKVGEFNKEKKLGSFNLSLEKFEEENKILEFLKTNPSSLGIILDGRVINKVTGELSEIADVFHYNNLRDIDSYKFENALTLLKIKNFKKD